MLNKKVKNSTYLSDPAFAHTAQIARFSLQDLFQSWSNNGTSTLFSNWVWVYNYHWQLSEFLNVVAWVTVQLVSNIIATFAIILG